MYMYLGFPAGSDSKESACNAGDPGLPGASVRNPAHGKGHEEGSLTKQGRDQASGVPTGIP